MAPTVAVVLGTFNRRALLETCLTSVRRSVGALSYVVLVADGGSTDGSREWLTEQPDCELLEGGLDGAVRAFNVAFARAVDLEAPYVCIINDDDRFVGPEVEIARAVELLESDPGMGGVTFETNLRQHEKDNPPWGFEQWGPGLPYCNKGVIRCEAGMAAARAQGDPTGRAWWGHEHHTYAADTECGLWIWRLGWTIGRGFGLRIDDSTEPDTLRRSNEARHTASESWRGYLARWGRHDAANYNRADAEAHGGIIR
jgi:glycosyltransferase involved in cell wall biosynthesis